MDKREYEAKADEIYPVLAKKLRGILQKLHPDFAKLQEIRIRVGNPFLVVYEGKEHFITESGEMTQDGKEAFVVSQKEVRETMEYISNYSMYAFEEELRRGYITIRGGHRVGVAGKMIWERDGVRNMKHITFINIRMAHQILGCADDVLPYLRQGNSICHTLLISPPRCGKTTLLRDLIRQFSNGGKGYAGMTVGVVDERSEIGACYRGKPQNNLGIRTDILDGCPKVEGMMMLVRSMAPDIIAIDEVGSGKDVEAMEYVMSCGIKLLATVHGNSIDDIQNKPLLGKLVREKVFERYILLAAGKIGKIQAVFDERGSLLWDGNRVRVIQDKEAC